MRFHQFAKPGDVTYVVILSETGRDVNEIHTDEQKIQIQWGIARKSSRIQRKHVLQTKKETWVLLASEKLVQTLSILFQIRLPWTQGRPFTGMRRSGLLFLLIPNAEVIWHSLFPRLSQPCYVTSIKTNENLMDPDIGKQLNPYC